MRDEAQPLNTLTVPTQNSLRLSPRPVQLSPGAPPASSPYLFALLASHLSIIGQALRMGWQDGALSWEHPQKS